jgi:hypothetical protein
MAKEDAFDPQPNGTIKFVIDGALHTLRRPKIKEFRNLREVLADIGANSIEDVEEAAAAVEKGEAPPSLRDEAKRQEREDELLEWWQLVFKTLNSDDKPFPSNDELPMWLFDGEIIPTVLKTWLSVPPRLGAK